MKQYEVYFSLYGKHLRTTVMAYSEEDAYRQVRERLIIHKDKTKVLNDPLEDLKNVFGFK